MMYLPEQLERVKVNHPWLTDPFLSPPPETTRCSRYHSRKTMKFWISYLTVQCLNRDCSTKTVQGVQEIHQTSGPLSPVYEWGENTGEIFIRGKCAYMTRICVPNQRFMEGRRKEWQWTDRRHALTAQPGESGGRELAWSNQENWGKPLPYSGIFTGTSKCAIFKWITVHNSVYLLITRPYGSSVNSNFIFPFWSQLYRKGCWP